MKDSGTLIDVIVTNNEQKILNRFSTWKMLKRRRINGHDYNEQQ